MFKRLTALILCASLLASTAHAGKFDFIRGLGKSGDDVARQADEIDGGGNTIETLGDAAGDAAGLAIDGASAVSGDSSDDSESSIPDWLVWVIVGVLAVGLIWQVWQYIKSVISGMKWLGKKISGGGKTRRRRGQSNNTDV